MPFFKIYRGLWDDSRKPSSRPSSDSDRSRDTSEKSRSICWNGAPVEPEACCMPQISFSDAEYSGKRKQTRREWDGTVGAQG